MQYIVVRVKHHNSHLAYMSVLYSTNSAISQFASSQRIN